MWNDSKRLLAASPLECAVIKCLSAIIRWCVLASIHAVSAVSLSRLLFHFSLSLTVARNLFRQNEVLWSFNPLLLTASKGLFDLLLPRWYRRQ